MQNQKQPDTDTKTFNPQANPNINKSSDLQGQGLDQKARLAREQINKGEEEIDVERQSDDKNKDFNTDTYGKGGRVGRENMQPNKSGSV